MSYHKIVQAKIEAFDRLIKLSDEDGRADLREKRELLIDELKSYLSKENLPSFISFNQGSYAMGTGVVPVDKDFDIDVALFFNIAKDDYNPITVKKWVHNALNKGNRTVAIRKPCVTVKYMKDGESQYHVDFAVYSAGNSDEKVYLAKGKEFSASTEISWEIAEPKKLKDLINSKFNSSDEKEQFKRIIRLLKRWKDNKFLSEGNNAPTGIALTALVYENFQPIITKDLFTGEIKIDDLSALKELLNRLIYPNYFNTHLPVEPRNNLFKKMTELQKNSLNDKLKELKNTIQEAINDADPYSACEKLQKAFGEEFPLPDKKETAQKCTPAITSSQEQA